LLHFFQKATLINGSQPKHQAKMNKVERMNPQLSDFVLKLLFVYKAQYSL